MKTARLVRTLRRSAPFYLLLGAVIFILLFPFYWGLITSLKYEVEIYDFSGNFLVPKNPSLDNYRTVFQTPNYFIWFRNTTVVAGITTVISVVTVATGGGDAGAAGGGVVSLPPPPPPPGRPESAVA